MIQLAIQIQCLDMVHELVRMMILIIKNPCSTLFYVVVLT